MLSWENRKEPCESAAHISGLKERGRDKGGPEGLDDREQVRQGLSAASTVCNDHVVRAGAQLLVGIRLRPTRCVSGLR